MKIIRCGEQRSCFVLPDSHHQIDGPQHLPHLIWLGFPFGILDVHTRITRPGNFVDGVTRTILPELAQMPLTHLCHASENRSGGRSMTCESLKSLVGAGFREVGSRNYRARPLISMNALVRAATPLRIFFACAFFLGQQLKTR